MPTPAAEVHVNDIGTKYRLRIRDEDGDLDPSGAILRELIFKLPQGVITKPADVEGAGGSPPTFWYLTYTVGPAAGLGSPPGEFHAEHGRISIQGRLTYGDGTVFHTDVQTTDDDGALLFIHRNLTG